MLTDRLPVRFEIQAYHHAILQQLLIVQHFCDLIKINVYSISGFALLEPKTRYILVCKYISMKKHIYSETDTF